MIRSLRRKFVAVTMAIVTALLVRPVSARSKG